MPKASHKDDGELTYGLRAGLALFEVRRQDILRVAFSRVVESDVRGLAAWAREERVPIDVRDENELERIARSPHHEGLCVLARPRRWTPASELAQAMQSGVAVALDRVRNPYNVGAILRTAAFFGVRAAILGAIAPHPALASDAIRVAEGGVEHLSIARTTDLADTLGRLRAKGVHVAGADAAAGRSAIGARFERPLVLVLGHEREGLSPRVRAQCDVLLALRGTGKVESLNVAAAAAILIAEAVRTG